MSNARSLLIKIINEWSGISLIRNGLGRGCGFLDSVEGKIPFFNVKIYTIGLDIEWEIILNDRFCTAGDAWQESGARQKDTGFRKNEK